MADLPAAESDEPRRTGVTRTPRSDQRASLFPPQPNRGGFSQAQLGLVLKLTLWQASYSPFTTFPVSTYRSETATKIAPLMPSTLRAPILSAAKPQLRLLSGITPRKAVL